MQEICKNADQSEVVHSILPILTKGKQKDNFDLDERRQTVAQLILKEIENRRAQDTVLQQNAENDPDMQMEQEKALEYYKK